MILSAIAGEAITRQGDAPARARLFHSADGGRTWARPGSTPFTPLSAEDHPVLAVGRRNGEVVAHAVATHATSEQNGIDVAPVRVSPGEAESIPPLRPDREQLNLGGAVVGTTSDLIVSVSSMSPARSCAGGA